MTDEGPTKTDPQSDSLERDTQDSAGWLLQSRDSLVSNSTPISSTVMDKPPLERTAVSGPVAVIDKGVKGTVQWTKTGVNLTKKVATATTKSVTRLINSGSRKRDDEARDETSPTGEPELQLEEDGNDEKGTEEAVEKTTTGTELVDQTANTNNVHKAREQASALKKTPQKGASNMEKKLSWSDSGGTRDQAITVGRVLSFLLCDSTIIMGGALLVGMIPTIRSLNVIIHSHIPVMVTIGWVVAAFVMGEELGRIFGPRGSDYFALDYPSKDADETSDSIAGRDRRHSIFLNAQRRLSVASDKTVRFSDREDEVARVAPSPKKRGSKFVNLLRRVRFHRRPQWKDNTRIPSSADLKQRLNHDPSLRPNSSNEQIAALKASVSPDRRRSSIGSMGAFDIHNSPAKSLEDSGVEPLLKLRGMDVFLAGGDGAEDEIGKHPFLINCGLRRKNSALVNVMLPWGNLLIYFLLPDWFEEFGSVVEHEDDPDDVKALKRFINGDDEYKMKRLRLLPSIVDGPRIIRYLAPSKELAIPQKIVPVTFNRIPGGTDARGNKLCPLIEVELDCMSNKAMRAMAGVFKRNLARLTLDLAVLIRSPEGSTQEEPSACLGMWRFDKVHVDECPTLPKRQVSVAEEIRRASAIIGLSPREIKEIEQEA